MSDIYQKIILGMLSIMIAVSGWFGKTLYDSTQINSQRLTILESTFMDKYESGNRLAILEHRVDNLETKKPR